MAAAVPYLLIAALVGITVYGIRLAVASSRREGKSAAKTEAVQKGQEVEREAEQVLDGGRARGGALVVRLRRRRRGD